MCRLDEFLRGQDDQFSYKIIVHILLATLSDMCHNSPTRDSFDCEVKKVNVTAIST